MKIFFPKENSVIYSMDLEKDIDSGLQFARDLNKKNISGEFFITAKMVLDYPSECRKISQNHFTGGHGFNHENYAKLSFSEQKKLIIKTKNVFLDNSIDFNGWRFPGFNFSSVSLKLLSLLKINDYSIRENHLSFPITYPLRLFFRNGLNGVFSFPFLLPSGLNEFPWSYVDLAEKNIFSKKGRLVLHCYNYSKIRDNFI